MNISFINYYPKFELDKDNTHHSIEYITNLLADFIKSYGHTVHQINLQELQILPCLGCSDDPFFIPMEYCRQDDDMNKIYPILRSSEIWIFNFAVNQKKLPRQVCNFLDRLEPLFDREEKEFLAPLSGYPEANQGQVYLIATSEHWSNEIFSEIINEIQTLAFLFRRNYLGEFLRPHMGIFVQKVVKPNYSQFESKIEELAKGILNQSISISSNGLDLFQTVIEREEYEKIISNFI